MLGSRSVAGLVRKSTHVAQSQKTSVLQLLGWRWVVNWSKPTGTSGCFKLVGKGYKCLTFISIILPRPQKYELAPGQQDEQCKMQEETLRVSWPRSRSPKTLKWNQIKSDQWVTMSWWVKKIGLLYFLHWCWITELMSLVSIPCWFDLDVNVGRRILGCVSVLDNCLYRGSLGLWGQKNEKETEVIRSGSR